MVLCKGEFNPKRVIFQLTCGYCNTFEYTIYDFRIKAETLPLVN